MDTYAVTYFLYLLVGALLGWFLRPYRQHLGSSQKESPSLFVFMTAFMWPVLLFVFMVAALHRKLQRWEFWQGGESGIRLLQIVGVVLMLIVVAIAYRRAIYRFFE